MDPTSYVSWFACMREMPLSSAHTLCFCLVALMSTKIETTHFSFLFSFIMQYKHGFELSPSLALFLTSNIYKSERCLRSEFSFFNFFLILFNAKSLQNVLKHSSSNTMLEVQENLITHARNISTSYVL